MGEVKQVTDNVAHDLRTPLMRMRGRLEKASIGRREAEGDQSLISAAMADLDDVLRMFSSLTRISQIEAANRTAAFRTVDLAEVAAEVVELFDAAAEDKGGHIRVVDGEPVLVSAVGDRLPPERELARQLSVGRSSLREAMQGLQTMGLVEVRHGVGTFFTSEPSRWLLSPLRFSNTSPRRLFAELIEARLLVEVRLAALAAERAAREDIARIKEAAERRAHAARGQYLDKLGRRAALRGTLTGNSFVAYATARKARMVRDRWPTRARTGLA